MKKSKLSMCLNSIEYGKLKDWIDAKQTKNVTIDIVEIQLLNSDGFIFYDVRVHIKSRYRSINTFVAYSIGMVIKS